MSYTELFLLAVGLCFDTFAVSISGGISLDSTKLRWYNYLKIFLFFALFQAGFTFIGWILGSSVREFIEKFDHWIAFILLLYIGGKMALDSFSKEECECERKRVNLLSTKQLTILSIATSIDALAVGISLAMVSLSGAKLTLCLAMIFTVTAIASCVGLFSGKRVGCKFGKRSNLLGGLILIAIGVKILIEHLFL